MNVDRDIPGPFLFLGDPDTEPAQMRDYLCLPENSRRFLIARNREEMLKILEDRRVLLILIGPGQTEADGLNLPGSPEILANAMPLIFVTPRPSQSLESWLLGRGASATVSLSDIWRLPSLVGMVHERDQLAKRMTGQDILLAAVKELSLARRIEDVVEIIRHATRRLSQAEGATFVLREGDQCHYLDEDAIEPLWKGRRFPLTACISGWAMLNKRAAVVEDIYADSRIPIDAYRPTFVKSLVMVPIRSESPIGAIGTYWARKRATTEAELELIQALADSASLAIENVRTHGELESRVRERTASLEAANKELEAFSYTVCHDLRSPLSVIAISAQMLRETSPSPLQLQEGLERIDMAAERMRTLIEDMINLSRVTKTEIRRRAVDISDLARSITRMLEHQGRTGNTRFFIAEGMQVHGDPALLRIALENLVANAIKYSALNPAPSIRIGFEPEPLGKAASFFVEDNGIGFPMEEAGNLFQPFRRLSSSAGFPGTGVGLATVARVIEKHGGSIWAESSPGQGSIFHFSVPEPANVSPFGAVLESASH